MIANAEMIIVVDIWSEDLHWIEDALLEAESRGITVILITIGACQLSLKNIFVHARDEEWPTDERKFSVLCDSRSAILGSFGSAIKPSALETDHPAVIETLKNAFYHDIIMQHIERDFGVALKGKYGENYKKLLELYTKEKGWNI